MEDDWESKQGEALLFKNVDEWNAAITLMKYQVLCKGWTDPITYNLRII